eukprot:RCo044704
MCILTPATFFPCIRVRPRSMTWVFEFALSALILSLYLDPAEGVRPCPRCRFEAITFPQPKVEFKLTSLSGSGRLDTFVAAIHTALGVGYLCRARVELPVHHDPLGAFHLKFRHSKYDFGLAPVLPSTENVSSVCHSVSGDSRKFLSHSALLAMVSPRVKKQLMNCVRLYLGLCTRVFCESEDVGERTLVMHLPQGGARPPPPSLTYYLSAINFTRPEKIVVVHEPGTESPVLRGLRALAKLRMLHGTVRFQSKKNKEDLRALICAQMLVESRTPLMHVAQLGFARRTFTSRCRSAFFPDSTVYRIKGGGSGSRELLPNPSAGLNTVDALLGAVERPVACGRGTFQTFSEV